MKSNIITNQSEIEAIINQCEACCMSMVDENGLPYNLPFNFAYEDNVLFFHAAPFGRKIEILKAKPDVCIVFSTAHDLHHHSIDVGCSYSMKFKSVIAFGKAEFFEDIEEKKIWMNKFMQKYTHRDFEYSLPAITNVNCFKVVIDKISGKKRGY